MQVVLIAGETGCGKTTQVRYFLLLFVLAEPNIYACKKEFRFSVVV